MTDSEDVALGSAIRRVREARGITQHKLAKDVGMAPPVLGRVELGTRPSRSSELNAIAKALGVDANYLLKEGTPPTPAELLQDAVLKRGQAVEVLAAYGTAVVLALAANRAEFGNVVAVDGRPLLGDQAFIDYLRRGTPVAISVSAPAASVDLVQGLLADLVDRVTVFPEGDDDEGEFDDDEDAGEDDNDE